MVLTAQQHGPSKSMDATCPCCLLSGCFRHCIDTYNILQKNIMFNGFRFLIICFNAWILSRKQAMIPAAFLCVMMQFPNCPDLLRQGVGQWWGRILADSWANAFDCTYDLCLSLYSHTYVRVMCVCMLDWTEHFGHNLNSCCAVVWWCRCFMSYGSHASLLLFTQICSTVALQVLAWKSGEWLMVD